MDPVTISVSEFSIYPYMAGFTFAIAAVIVSLIVGLDRLGKRRRLQAWLFLLGGLIVAFAVGAVSFTTLISSTEAHERAQIDSIDNQLSQELGLPVHSFGEDIIGFVRTPSGFGETVGAQLRLTYKIDGETYWQAIDVKRVAPVGEKYGFEVYQVGEPKPIEDFIDDMAKPLTPEGLIPTEDAR